MNTQGLITQTLDIIDDRLLAPLPVSLVAIEKILLAARLFDPLPLGGIKLFHRRVVS